MRDLMASKELTPVRPRHGDSLRRAEAERHAITCEAVEIFDHLEVRSPDVYVHRERGRKLRLRADDFIQRMKHRRHPSVQAVKLLVIIPAHNEEKDLAFTLDSLLGQTRPIDKIVVVANNCREGDQTANLARFYAKRASVNIVVEEVKKMEDGKVGALNFAWRKHSRDFDFVFTMDADTVLERDAIEQIESELAHRTNLGGIMARYNFKTSVGRRGRTLVNLQRHEFATTTIQQQLWGNETLILGGQATLFRNSVLHQVAEQTDGRVPWDRKSAVEDAELTRGIHKLGLETAVSPTARAWPGAMFRLSTLFRQRRKWEEGHLRSLVTDFSPSLDRRRWFHQVKNLFDLIVRLAFVTLLAVALDTHTWLWSWIWIAPIGLAIILNTMIAWKIPDRTWREIGAGMTYVLHEVYLCFGLLVWICSLGAVVLSPRKDMQTLWKAQGSAEQRSATSRMGSDVGAYKALWLFTMLFGAWIVGLLLLIPFISHPEVKSAMFYGWSVLKILTILTTLPLVWKILQMIRYWKVLHP